MCSIEFAEDVVFEIFGANVSNFVGYISGVFDFGFGHFSKYFAFLYGFDFGFSNFHGTLF